MCYNAYILQIGKQIAAMYESTVPGSSPHIHEMIRTVERAQHLCPGDEHACLVAQHNVVLCTYHISVCELLTLYLAHHQPARILFVSVNSWHLLNRFDSYSLQVLVTG